MDILSVVLSQRLRRNKHHRTLCRGRPCRDKFFVYLRPINRNLVEMNFFYLTLTQYRTISQTFDNNKPEVFKCSCAGREIGTSRLQPWALRWALAFTTLANKISCFFRINWFMLILYFQLPDFLHIDYYSIFIEYILESTCNVTCYWNNLLHDYTCECNNKQRELLQRSHETLK